MVSNGGGGGAQAGEAGSAAAAADAPSSSTQRLRPCRASRPLQDTTLASLVDALYDRLDVRPLSWSHHITSVLQA